MPFSFEFHHFCLADSIPFPFFHYSKHQFLGVSAGEDLGRDFFGLYYLPKKGYFLDMAHKILIKKSVIKGIGKIPPNIQKKFKALVEVLQASGTRGATD